MEGFESGEAVEDFRFHVFNVAQGGVENDETAQMTQHGGGDVGQTDLADIQAFEEVVRGVAEWKVAEHQLQVGSVNVVVGD